MNKVARLQAIRTIDELNEQAWLLRDADIESVQANLDQVSVLFEEGAEHHQGFAQFLCTQGFLHFRQGAFGQGLDMLFEAERLCNEHGPVALLPRIYGTVANCYRQLLEVDLSNDFLSRQLAISEELGDAEGVASAKHNMAYDYQLIGSYDEALKIYHQVEAALAAGQDHWHGVLIKINMSRCYAGKGELTRARELLRVAAQFVERSGHDFAKLYTCGGYLNLYQHAGQFEKALKEADRYLLLGYELDIDPIRTLNTKAEILIMMGRHADAVTILNDICVHPNISITELAKAQKMRIRCFTELNQFDELIAASNEFIAATEQLEHVRLRVRRGSIDRSHQLEVHRRAAETAQESNRALTEKIEELNNLRELYYQQSMLDPLTGLANRRFIYKFLTSSFTAAKENGAGLGVALMDLDLFKTVNDTYSHQVGDEVLVQIARILQGYCRKSDAIARFGGEEFILVFADNSIEGNLARCEQVRVTIEHYDWDAIAPGLCVTASFGVSSLATVANCKTFDDLITHADNKLYESKKGGRNRSTC